MKWSLPSRSEMSIDDYTFRSAVQGSINETLHAPLQIHRSTTFRNKRSTALLRGMSIVMCVPTEFSGFVFIACPPILTDHVWRVLGRSDFVDLR